MAHFAEWTLNETSCLWGLLLLIQQTALVTHGMNKQPLGIKLASN